MLWEKLQVSTGAAWDLAALGFPNGAESGRRDGNRSDKELVRVLVPVC